jgi:hypothetical protein
MFLIWSIEHDAWWAPAERGYTQRIADAGMYTDDESAKILERANYVAVNEARLPIQATLNRDSVRIMGRCSNCHDLVVVGVIGEIVLAEMLCPICSVVAGRS